MSSSSQKRIRRMTRKVKVGNITIGGDEPIVVQSMANVPTHDIDRCVAQINAMVEQGCELVRLAVPGKKDTQALPEILNQVQVPVVADVHFHYRRALEAIEAGVNKIRLNPGNIKDRKQVEEVIAACKSNQVAIRVGVNEGSIRQRHNEPVRRQEQGGDLIELMAAKLQEYVRIFEDNNFAELVLSGKCHDAWRCVELNRALSERFDYPLHIGVTHAGDVQSGSVRSATALGALLSEGIGDTIRVSLAGDPLTEIEVAWEILDSLNLRRRERARLIACPTCGRTQIDVIGMVEQVKQALVDIKTPVKVAVMGCVVNGPGEAEEADVALCGGKEKAMIYRGGRKVATVNAEKAVEVLLEQVKIFISEQQK